MLSEIMPMAWLWASRPETAVNNALAVMGSLLVGRRGRAGEDGEELVHRHLDAGDVEGGDVVVDADAGDGAGSGGGRGDRRLVGVGRSHLDGVEAAVGKLLAVVRLAVPDDVVAAGGRVGGRGEDSVAVRVLDS